MGQDLGKIWAAQTRLQSILSKSDRLLGTSRGGEARLAKDQRGN